MPRDLQDIPATPAGTCILIEDRFEVLKGLVTCSDDVESGCLEPFEINQLYRAYMLNVSNAYYSTQIQILSFDSLDNYIKWHSDQRAMRTVHPSALFVCVDVNKSESDLREFLLKLDGLDIDKVDTRSLLLFGRMPPSKNNVSHPKAEQIQRFIEKHYVEVVRFQPNEEELEELEENREIHGILRVWELLNIAEWPLKIMKNNRGNRTSTNRPNGVASSVSQKCDTSLLAVYSTLEDGREYPETSSSALNQVIPDLEPTSEDEQFIYNFLMSTKPIPEPEFTISKTPELSMQYLMAQRKGMPRRPDAPQNERILRYPTVVPIKQNHLSCTETTLVDCSNVNTQMSIINTVKQFEPDKETRAGSTSINVASLTQPLTTEQVSIVQQSKRKKKLRGKKPSDDESPEQPIVTESADINDKETIERIFDRLNQKEDGRASGKSLEELVQIWNDLKDKPPSDEQVHVATQLAKFCIEEQEESTKTSGFDLRQHLAEEINKMKDRELKPESKKDK